MSIEPLLAAHGPPPVSPESRGPQWAIVLAACLPLGACPVAPAIFVASTGGFDQVAARVNEGGYFVYLVLLAFGMGVVVSSLAIGLMARGVRIPPVVAVAFAALPWLVGVAGMRTGMKMMLGVLSEVNPADKATILAAGISEASVNRMVGALFSSVLLGCVGLGLAFASLARSREQSATGALIGLVAAGPMLLAALFVPSMRESGALGMLPVLPAAAALVGLVIASRAAGPDAPHARSAALAASVGAPFGIAFVGAAVAVVVAQVSGGAMAIANVAPADKASIAVAISLEAKSLALLSTWGWALAAVPVLAAGGWAVMRGSTVKPPIGSLVASALLLGVVAAADLSATRGINEAVGTLGEPRPWSSRPGFQPLSISGAPGSEPVDAVLGPDDWNTLATVLQGKQQRRVVLAVDARVSPEQLAQLVDAVRAAGAESLTLVGEPTRVLPAAMSPYDPAGWLVRLLDGPSSVELFIGEHPYQRETADLDPNGLSLAALVEKALAIEREGKAPRFLPPPERPSTADPEVDPLAPVEHGGLARDVIYRVIKKSMGPFRFCYERELQKKPQLGGKVSIAFTVTANGSVSDALVRDSTLNDTEVEACLVARFKKLKFPKPLGGGVVKVTFPFVFKAAD